MALYYRGARYSPECHTVSGVETGLKVQFLGRCYPLMTTTYEQKQVASAYGYQFRGVSYRR
ncbi:MAG: hypothetical protein WBA57_19765 [Elainellaceae cyanobacterium]